MATEPTNGYISRGNMTVMISAAGLVMLAFGGFITYQNGTMDRRLTEMREDTKATLRKDEHEEFKLRIDRDINLIREEQQRRAGSIVPRTEHEARWIATDNNIKVLSDRLNELRTATTSTYTIRDEVISLKSEVQELRKQLADRK